jgi:hypothetical protein
MIQAMVAVWRLRPSASRWRPTALGRAMPIALTTLACTACANPQAARPAPLSDVSCVRAVETTGGSFLKAVAHCEKNPFDTFYPTLLDLSGAPDLQKQAFDSGYYNRDLPASNAAEGARLQTLQAGLADAMVVRQKRQGKTVTPLSNTGCLAELLDVPHEAFALGPRWDGGRQSPTNPYLTPQENACVARQRDAAAPARPAPAVSKGVIL